MHCLKAPERSVRYRYNNAPASVSCIGREYEYSLERCVFVVLLKTPRCSLCSLSFLSIPAALVMAMLDGVIAVGMYVARSAFFFFIYFLL